MSEREEDKEDAGGAPFRLPLDAKKVAIVCHRHADPDAYLSAYALSFLLRQLSPEAQVDIIVPDGMSLLTRQLQDTFKHDTMENSKTEYDTFFAVDMGHAELMKDWLARVAESKGPRILIDHHPIQQNDVYTERLVDETASSTAEMILRIFKAQKVAPDVITSQALLVAILFDSQHLGIAGDSALRAVVSLMDTGAEIEAARRVLRSPPDYGAVVARLKAAKRANSYKLGGWVVVVSTVGSFQAQVARSFVGLGADVAVVAGDFEEETRVSLRSSQRFYEATKVHMGVDVAEKVSKQGGGQGGGHPTAASFTCTLGEEKAVKNSLDLLAQILKEEPQPIR